MSKTKKLPSTKKIALEFLHQRLDHRSTRSLLAGDTATAWEDIELRIYPDPFCISCHIYSKNIKDRYKNPLNPKAPFNWVLIDIIPSTAPIFLTSDTTFYNYLLIFDAYSKNPKLYGKKKISTEGVVDKLDIFPYRFGKMDKFGSWDIETISADVGS